ncbi:MAG: hypothetical protein IPK39_20280 [Sulfuritalea sp.]|nr:hypothetical protein [Sulfuritalea sp.]
MRSSLAQALEQAWRLHPKAAALEAREAEARANRDIAAGLTPEPGSVSISSRNDQLSRNLGKQEYEVELSTPLWLPGQKAAREAEATSRIDEASAKRAALRMVLAGELRDAWWTLAAARNAQAWPPVASIPHAHWPMRAAATRSASCRASTPTWRRAKCMRPAPS